MAQPAIEPEPPVQEQTETYGGSIEAESIEEAPEEEGGAIEAEASEDLSEITEEPEKKKEEEREEKEEPGNFWSRENEGRPKNPELF